MYILLYIYIYIHIFRRAEGKTTVARLDILQSMHQLPRNQYVPLKCLDMGLFQGLFQHSWFIVHFHYDYCYLYPNSRWWFQIVFIFTPTWGKIPILANIFQTGWNHQLVTLFKSNEGILDHLMSRSGKFVSTESSKPKQGREKPTTRNDETWGCIFWNGQGLMS